MEILLDFMGNPVGPARVWLKHENIPGLAMARSIGDRIAAQVGVIAEPGNCCHIFYKFKVYIEMTFV